MNIHIHALDFLSNPAGVHGLIRLACIALYASIPAASCTNSSKWSKCVQIDQILNIEILILFQAAAAGAGGGAEEDEDELDDEGKNFF